MRTAPLVTCILSTFAALGQAQVQPAKRQDIPTVVASARGTVVLLKTFDRQGKVLGLGSGFRIVRGRYVTNAHVVAGATRVEIFDDAGTLLGIARAADMLSTTVDLAILPSVGRRTPYLSFATASPQVGEQVIVIGAPEGLTNTVSDGIVSARRIIGGRRLLQISAPISPGSSGGPVLNTRGEVIGVSESILRQGQNLNFAVPVSDVITLVSSRPGSFEFPASTEEPSESLSPPDGFSRSDAAAGWPMLHVNSGLDAKLTLDDKQPNGGFADYYRLEGAEGPPTTIQVNSPEFAPSIAVFRLLGDSLVTVATAKGDNDPRVARAKVSLSAGVTYFVVVTATNESPSKMGWYGLVVAVATEDMVASPSAAGEEGTRWVPAGSSRQFQHEYDRSRITRSAYGSYLVWVRSTYGTPYTAYGLTFDVVMSQYEFSCGDTRYRIVSAARYLKGALVWSTSMSTPWESAVPETMAEISGRVICSYVRAHGL